jgi:hypothetical protein
MVSNRPLYSAHPIHYEEQEYGMSLIKATSRKSRVAIAAIALGSSAVMVTSCSSGNASAPNAQDHGAQVAQNRENYSPQNDVEGHNYNARQRIADDPSTIIWCSIMPSNPNIKPWTVPIIGKLTSGNKRPYPTTRELDGGGDGTAGSDFFSPEVPGPDGFYGSSGEYRYGFDPSGNYHDVYNMETYCTSVPNIIQKQTTTITVTATGDLKQVDRQAEDALRVCRAANPDPSVPCNDAANILGVN